MGRKLGIPEGAEFMTLDDFIVEKVERKKGKKDLHKIRTHDVLFLVGRGLSRCPFVHLGCLF